VQFNQIFKLGTALDNSTAAFNSEKPAQKNKDSISLDIQEQKLIQSMSKKENTNLIPKTKSRNNLRPVHPPTRRDFSALTT